MPARDGFYRRTGLGRTRKFTDAGSDTVAIGDAMQLKEGSGNITLITAAGQEILGVALEASTSAATTPILIDIVMPGDEFQAKIQTGTMANTEVGQEADFADEDALTLTESSGDCSLVGWDGIDTTMAYVVFNNCDYGSPGVNVD